MADPYLNRFGANAQSKEKNESRENTKKYYCIKKP